MRNEIHALQEADIESRPALVENADSRIKAKEKRVEPSQANSASPYCDYFESLRITHVSCNICGVLNSGKTVSRKLPILTKAHKGLIMRARTHTIMHWMTDKTMMPCIIDSFCPSAAFAVLKTTFLSSEAGT
jgi:hypothetical protein